MLSNPRSSLWLQSWSPQSSYLQCALDHDTVTSSRRGKGPKLMQMTRRVAWIRREPGDRSCSCRGRLARGRARGQSYRNRLLSTIALRSWLCPVLITWGTCTHHYLSRESLTLKRPHLGLIEQYNNNLNMEEFKEPDNPSYLDPYISLCEKLKENESQATLIDSLVHF